MGSYRYTHQMRCHATATAVRDTSERTMSPLFAMVRYLLLRYKIARRLNDHPWETTGSVPAQIFCGIAGSITARIGFVLAELGPNIVYRHLEDTSNENDNPVFIYYSVSNNARFCDCTGPKAPDGRKTALRILFEILLSTTIRPTKSKSLPTMSPMAPVVTSKSGSPRAKRSRDPHDSSQNAKHQNVTGTRGVSAEHVEELEKSSDEYIFFV